MPDHHEGTSNGIEEQETVQRPFFYSIHDLPSESIADTVARRGFDEAESQKWFDLFGRDLLTKRIFKSSRLTVTHETVGPGARVKPHRHGTHQITYVLRGSLRYGNQVTTAGMGSFTPNTRYSWTAGDEGAEWIEIHAGNPVPYVD